MRFIPKHLVWKTKLLKHYHLGDVFRAHNGGDYEVVDVQVHAAHEVITARRLYF